MPKCVIIAPLLNSRVLLFAKAFQHQGFKVHLLSNNSGPDNDQNDAFSRQLLINHDFGLELEPIQTAPVIDTDILLLAIGPWLTSRKFDFPQIGRFVSRADRTVLVGGFGSRQYLKRCKFDIQLIFRQLDLILRTHKVIHKDVSPLYSPLSLFVKQDYIGPGFHQMFFLDPKLKKSIYSESLLSGRRFLYNFVGSKSNGARKNLIPEIEHALKSQGWNLDTHRIKPYQPSAYWWAYERSSESLSAMEYLKLLDQSYFTLCLPGVAGTTERVCEAILRGSIPVLNKSEVPFYRLPLVNKKNAIFIDNANEWCAAINYIESLSQKELNDFSKQALLLRKHLHWSTLCKNLVTRLVND